MTQMEELTALCRQLLDGCRKTAFDGTVLFTPDGVANYDALWVRDLGYMAEYCGDLLGADAVENCIRFVLRGQREDGWFPDRVESSGEAVYAAGEKGKPVGEANLDNTPFLIFSVNTWCRELVSQEKATASFQEWAPLLDRGMDCIPLSEDGLVWNAPEKPHSPYGFTDTVCKTGRLLMESVLYWRACRMMESLYDSFQGNDAHGRLYAERAEKIEKALPQLWDEKEGLFMAADGLCRQPDIWGSAYLLAEKFPLPEEIRKRTADWLVQNRGRYLYRGQVSHLPDWSSWEKLLIEIPHGEYQNGACWATASGWVWQVFHQEKPEYAQELLDELLEVFRSDGVYECMGSPEFPEYRKLPQFVVSAVNVRGALRRAE